MDEKNNPVKEIKRHNTILFKKRYGILKSLREGATHYTASVKAGIHITTLQMWLRKAEDYKDDPDNVYVKFARDVYKAKLASEELLLKKILEGQTETRREIDVVDTDGKRTKTTEITRSPTWRQAAWMLERRFPEKYASRQVVISEKSNETTANETDATKQLYSDDDNNKDKKNDASDTNTSDTEM